MNRTLDHFLDWLLSKGLSEGTGRQYLKIVRAALAGGDTVDPGRVLLPTLSQSTLVTRRAALKRWAAFTKDAPLLKTISSEATSSVVARGVAQKRHVNPLSGVDYDRFMRILDKYRGQNPLWVWPVVRLIAVLGLRAGQDALNLRREDLVGATDRFLVTCKGGKQRWLPVVPVADELAALVKLENWDTAVDLLGVGHLAAYNKVYLVIQTIAKEAGIADLHPHRLRHTAAMRLYERSGHDIVLVQKLLGHASVTTTQRYLSGDRIAEMGVLLGRKEVTP